jgi:hypothetical protein
MATVTIVPQHEFVLRNRDDGVGAINFRRRSYFNKITILHIPFPGDEKGFPRRNRSHSRGVFHHF